MLTPLEKAVLDLMLDNQGEPFETVRQQLARATVENRKFTGVGFFTYFAVPANAPVRRDLPDMEINGIGANLPGVQHGAGFILFIRDGVVRFLEGYTYDDPWPEKTDEFKLFRHGASK